MKLSWAWIVLIPFLFLPNFSPADTGFGVLEVSDFFILPLLLLLILMPAKKISRINAWSVFVPLIGFILWSLLGVIMIYFNFDYYYPNSIVLFSLLKVGKFTLYGIVPLLIATRISKDSIRSDFHWAYLGCSVFLAVSLLLESNYLTGGTVWDKASQFKSLNLISTAMAILIVYLTALMIEGVGSANWRRMYKLSLLLILPGFSLTQGRGGWVACLVGFTYMAYKRGLFRYRTLAVLTSFSIGVTALYFTNIDFKKQVDMTIFPERTYDPDYDQHIILGIDDGYRLGEAERQLKYFQEFILFGAGFYHRGGQTRLAGSGSHDFWLQMFLETGLFGGLLILYILLHMWRQAHSQVAKQNKLSLALSSALITAFVGGLSGEYYYGGLGLFTLFLVYAPLGSLPQRVKTLPTENKVAA